MDNKEQENINISIPKNLFILLVIGLLVIASVLVLQFVILPAGSAIKNTTKEIETARQQSISKAKIEERQEKKAISLAKGKLTKGAKAEMFVIPLKDSILRTTFGWNDDRVTPDRVIVRVKIKGEDDIDLLVDTDLDLVILGTTNGKDAFGL